MKTTFKAFILISLLITLYDFSACSQASFSAAPDVAAAACSTGSTTLDCVSPDGGHSFSYTISASSLQFDLLFVVDNSASMFALQGQIASKFPNLFNQINGYDYHIGIVNTDVTSATNPARTQIDGLPYTQDGNLIPFSNGAMFLDRNSINPQALFQTNITRQETLICQQWIAQNCNPNQGCTDLTTLHLVCPSEETRGIYAANLALSANASNGFFRDNVPLSVVILSNADERASGGQLSDYPLESMDEPQAFVSAVNAQFNNLKPTTVHSIIIRPPPYSDSQSCYNAEHFSATEFGWIGTIYSELSNLTGGVVGNICASDYSGVMNQIATSAVTSINNPPLPCASNNVQVSFSPASNAVPYSVNGTLLVFSSPLPASTIATITGTCQ
jgi:hypothetical protein